MTQNVTNELIYDVLKQLQADVAELKATLADHTRQFIRVREDINTLRGDDLRRESLQAQMDVRLQRIETRLNLTDA
jgi:parvulin-like peptidyl-prolyl isomerase